MFAERAALNPGANSIGQEEMAAAECMTLLIAEKFTVSLQKLTMSESNILMIYSFLYFLQSKQIHPSLLLAKIVFINYVFDFIKRNTMHCAMITCDK